MSKFTCPCCGHQTLESFHDWDICPVCCWEDDILGNEDIRSPVNRDMLLSQGQANYMIYGACSIPRRQFARAANDDEPLDPAWKPLERAIKLARGEEGG